MAIVSMGPNGMLRSSNRINLDGCSIVANNGDIQIITKDGKEINIAALMEEVQALKEKVSALETAYMEQTLLGANPGKIEP